MTPDVIVRAVQTYFQANWTATPVAYDNLSFDQPAGPWVRLSVLPGKAFSDEMGPGGSGHRNGVVKVQVFTNPDDGVQIGAALAGQIEALFRRQDIGEVFFNDDEEPYTTDNGVSGNNQQHTVTCPFWVWTGE